MNADETYTGDELLELPEDEVVYSKAMQGTLATISMLDFPDDMEIRVEERKTIVIVTSFKGGKKYKHLRLRKSVILKSRPIDLYQTFKKGLLPQLE